LPPLRHFRHATRCTYAIIGYAMHYYAIAIIAFAIEIIEILISD